MSAVERLSHSEDQRHTRDARRGHNGPRCFGRLACLNLCDETVLHSREVRLDLRKLCRVGRCLDLDVAETFVVLESALEFIADFTERRFGRCHVILSLSIRLVARTCRTRSSSRAATTRL